MSIPQQPGNLFTRPFASSGNYRIPPDLADTTGRASLAGGFPTETQLPLSEGGVAPNRLDVNGILYMLSSYGFWQQSGGQWSYSQSLGYTEPCLVYHNRKLWWCLQENGPDSKNGVVEPGEDENVWIEYLKKITGSSGGGGLTPVGSIIMYGGIVAPDGYLMCDGQNFSASSYPILYSVLGSSNTPDFRGCFARGYDPEKTLDPQGDRPLFTRQSDTGRNATGTVGGAVEEGSTYSGVFTLGGTSKGGDGKGKDHAIVFNLSRAWGAEHTGPEFRPYNLNTAFIIKHD